MVIKLLPPPPSLQSRYEACRNFLQYSQHSAAEQEILWRKKWLLFREAQARDLVAEMVERYKEHDRTKFYGWNIRLNVWPWHEGMNKDWRLKPLRYGGKRIVWNYVSPIPPISVQ